MPVLDNPRHEKFAQAVASGKKGTQAYRAVYGNHVVSARQQAHELLKDPDISGRVKELQAESNSEAVLTLQQQKELLTKVVLTPIGEIDESSPLCQSVKRSESMTEFKMVDKLGAITQLARLMGLLKDPSQTINLGLDITVLTEPERLELIRRKRACVERRNAVTGLQ